MKRAIRPGGLVLAAAVAAIASVSAVVALGEDIHLTVLGQELDVHPRAGLLPGLEL